MAEHKHGKVTGNYQGFPYRGDVMLLKKTDNETKLPQRFSETFVGLFALNDEKQMDEYTKICNQITRGEALMSFEERVFVPGILSWVVLMRWIEVWYAQAEELSK